MKAYNVQGWLFASKDLAIISGNTKHVQELDVPEGTELITGTVHLSHWGNSSENQIIFELSLSNDLDCTDLCNYEPVVLFEYEEVPNDDDELEAVLGHYETSGCNWKLEDLSIDLQKRVKSQLELECELIEL